MDYCLQAFTKLNPMTSSRHKYYMKHDIKTVANLYRVQNKSKRKETISHVITYKGTHIQQYPNLKVCLGKSVICICHLSGHMYIELPTMLNQSNQQ